MATATIIGEKARDLGFVAVGVAPAERLAWAEAALRARLAAKGLEGIDYFTPERASIAADPRALLPGAQAVLSLALPHDEAPEPPAPPLHGLVARYARGVDYHRRARERLKSLLEFIRRETGAASRAFVDATPLLERAFAARAGLGWFGKNNCLVTAERGSWVALAEVVTEAPLSSAGVPAEPASRCGACRACIDACPTGALRGPFDHRADRCLAYLTAELRGPIPRPLRPLLGARVLGCDSCQDICPWNREKASGRAQADEGGLPAWLSLPGLLALGEPAFAARFGATAAARARRGGLLRNAAVALGNAGDRAAAPALATALSDPEPLVRGHAAWALGRLGGRDARRELERARAAEPEAWVREELAAALEGCGG